ncbi:MAG: DUF711 family protein [Acidobacteriia bacterium]|nr:DUF711 family protein [Terriglobia bacterium]
MNTKRWALALIILALASFGLGYFLLAQAPRPTLTSSLRPKDNAFKIRAITAFISIDPAQVDKNVEGAAQFLNAARSRFQKAGYEVQTIRIATQPFPEYTRGLSRVQSRNFMKHLDTLAVQKGVDLSVGPGIRENEYDFDQIELLVDVLAQAKTTNSSVTVASPQKGVQIRSIQAAAQVIKHLSTDSKGGIGNFSFAAAANCPPGIPFFPTAYQEGASRQFALAIQSASLVSKAFSSSHSFQEAKAKLKDLYESQLQPVEVIARDLATSSHWSYEGMDVSTAPLGEVSIGSAIESLSGVPFGDHGTLAVAALITDVIKNLPLKLTGYSGLMIPVMEDATIARRAAEGHVTLDKLLMFSSVCATGIDVAPIPGDTSVEQIYKIILDVATLSTKLHKPLAVRLLVVPGKSVGEMTAFNDPFLVNTKVMSVK